jgi:ATP-dependent Zn protease
MIFSSHRCLPVNFAPAGGQGSSSQNLGGKAGANLADTDPMELDPTVRFCHVGGLDEHIRCLKEMVVFPMLYPEIFDKFKVQPPKGVLFHGPPGKLYSLKLEIFSYAVYFIKSSEILAHNIY